MVGFCKFNLKAALKSIFLFALQLGLPISVQSYLYSIAPAIFNTS